MRPQAEATDVLGPLFAGMTLQLLLAGVALGNFGAYLSTPNYRSDPRAHRVLLWAVVAQLVGVSALHAADVCWHGVDQDRTANGLYSIGVMDAVSPSLDGVVGALVQGFLLVRASQVSPAAETKDAGWGAEEEGALTGELLV